MENSKVLKLPFWKKIMYALGQLGWALTSFAVGNVLVYFYVPPETGGSTFPPFFYQGAVVGVLTFVGLVFAIGRLFDAVTDPVIAGLSDRCKWKFGRRRTFLAISVVPFALFSVLSFTPPVNGVSGINVVWVFITVLLFYLFMTMYVTPFFAWMSELGHDPDERLQLSTMISITWAIGFAIGSQIYSLQTLFESTMSPVDAFRTAIIIFAAVGFVFMLLPIIFIDESKYCEKHVSQEGIFQAVGSAFKNKNFLKFTLSDFAYWVSLTVITTGLIYYIMVLLEQPKEFASFLQLFMFLLSFLFYVPVTLIARKVGKKQLLIVGFICFVATYAFIFFLGKMTGLAPTVQGYILAVSGAIPMAIFGILPNAVIADIAEADGIENGNYKAGIFFGARTFMSKLGQSVAGIVFPSLLLLGKEPGNDIGVRLTALVALGFLVFGLLLLFLYREEEVNASLKKKA